MPLHENLQFKHSSSPTATACMAAITQGWLLFTLRTATSGWCETSYIIIIMLPIKP
jgi:hypothetical protein